MLLISHWSTTTIYARGRRGYPSIFQLALRPGTHEGYVVESLRSSSTAQSWVSSVRSARLFRASAIFAATTGFERFSARSWVGLTDEALLDLVHSLVLAVAVDPPSQQSSRRTSS